MRSRNPSKEETVCYFSDKPRFSDGQKSWYQKARDQFGLSTLRRFPTVLEECFQTPVDGAIYAEIIDRLRAQGAIRRAEVDSWLSFTLHGTLGHH